jgi:hypothetical protein
LVWRDTSLSLGTWATAAGAIARKAASAAEAGTKEFFKIRDRLVERVASPVR